MYGLPSYNEIDPTALLSISYILMFGIMFGDAGHGLILFIGGLLFYKLKKMDLGAIVASAGLSAIVFGFMYGEMFGSHAFLERYEFTKRLIVIEPMRDINTILIATIALGAIIILISMLVNIINAVKSRNWGRFLFDQNGLSGMVLYISALALIVRMLLNLGELPSWFTWVLIILPLALIFLKEPLTHLLQRKKDWMPKNKGEFFLESFFELFEIILSYATNTISFVRLGAFALGHASMMSVVFILAGMTSGAGTVIAHVAGNVLVICLEGLIVGIQALRLEFYEMFSRYYTGDGREFKSIKYSNLSG
jgi:V/A-type H+-transporting ATPase subunit I